jgi:benzodiazapine receptor
MTFNLIIIPLAIIITAVLGDRYIERGWSWYKLLHKPAKMPSGLLMSWIWIFVYMVTGLGLLWYWNVVVVYWLHYVVALVLLANIYYSLAWRKTLFVEHNLSKALQLLWFLQGTTVLATLLMVIDSPIASFLMVPYLTWVGILIRLFTRMVKINSKTE